MKIKKYDFVAHFIFLIFFCMTTIFQIYPSEAGLSYLCSSDVCKDIRKNQIYPHLFQKDFSVLTRVNHYLHNEIGTVDYIDFKKLEQHFRDASFEECIQDSKTVHICCLPNPYLNDLRKEICHFIETKIIPTVWSFGKSCFLHEFEIIATKCPGRVQDANILDNCHNYIKLISNNDADSDDITTISLDNEAGRLEYIRSKFGKEEQLSEWPIDHSSKNCSMTLYIIDHIHQSFESLDRYLDENYGYRSWHPSCLNDSAFIIILSSHLQNNKQIMQKLHDKLGKKIVYKCKYNHKLIYSCESCEKEPGVKLLYSDLFPDFSSPVETVKKEEPIDNIQPVNTVEEKIQEVSSEPIEKETVKKEIKSPRIEDQSIESSNQQKKMIPILSKFLKSNCTLITIASLGIGGFICLLYFFKFTRTFEPQDN